VADTSTDDDSSGRAAAAWLSEHEPSWLKPGLLALALVESALIVGQAWLIATTAVAVFVRGAALADAMPAMWLLLTVLLARAVLVGARQWMVASASVRVRRSLRAELLGAIERIGPVRMGSPGALVPAFDEQIEALDGFYARFVPQRVAATLVPLVLLAFVFASDWIAGLLLLVAAPLIPLFMALIGMGAEQLARSQFRAMARLGGWFLDRIRGASTLKLFRAERAARDDVLDRTDELRRESMRVLRLAFLSSATLEFFSSVAIAMVAIYIGFGLIGSIEFGPAPQLTLQSGLFVLLLAPEFFAPLRNLSQGWHDRADARAAVTEARAIIQRPPARPQADPGFRPDPPPASRVEIRGLNFAHPDREVLFDGLDLELQAGERVGLVGPSGCGKSTLISLLAGFLHPGGGAIELDGRPLPRFSRAALTAHVAWLGQRPLLLPGTIAENIALGARAADRARVEEIAELAQVAAFARRLPDGLDTRVGEGGVGLSGGQAQRVALARALIEPKPLVLLDEPTASLDPDSEAAVLDALGRVLGDRKSTVLCATHRAATIAWTQRRIEMRAGVIVGDRR
jgi:ATP-binding cassette subfamily C protein CydD